MTCPASHHFMLEGLKVHSSIALKGMQNTLSGVEFKPSKFRCIPQKWTLWHHGKIIENANVIEWHNFLTYLTCTINETKWWQLMTPDDTWPPNVWQISTELASFNGAILPFQGLAMHRWDPVGGPVGWPLPCCRSLPASMAIPLRRWSGLAWHKTDLMIMHARHGQCASNIE